MTQSTVWLSNYVDGQALDATINGHHAKWVLLPDPAFPFSQAP